MIGIGGGARQALCLANITRIIYTAIVFEKNSETSATPDTPAETPAALPDSLPPPVYGVKDDSSVSDIRLKIRLFIGVN